MINKTVKNVTEACADIQDGSTIMLGGIVTGKQIGRAHV